MALLASVPAGGLIGSDEGRRAALGKEAPGQRRQPAQGGLGVLRGAQSPLFFLKAELAVDTEWPVGSDGSSSQSHRAGEEPRPPTAPAAGALPGLCRAPPALRLGQLLLWTALGQPEKAPAPSLGQEQAGVRACGRRDRGMAGPLPAEPAWARLGSRPPCSLSSH